MSRVPPKWDQVSKHIDEHFDEFLEDTRRVLRQPSISGSGEGIRECALLIKEYLSKLGADVRLLEYGGHPIVYGRIKGGGDCKPLIMYSMYDVQPPDPIDAWIAPPFEARIVGDQLIARGAYNTKGPLMAFITAVRTLLNTISELPMDIIFVIEGEEEIGSPSMPKLVEDKGKELSEAGLVLFPEMSENEKGIPAISLGNKGIVFLELRVHNADLDIHSSLAQGIVSPVARLIHALSILVGPEGEVLVKELYDDVISPTDEDLRYLKDIMEFFDINELVKLYNIRKLRYAGEELYKVVFFHPSINIDGLIAGYMGPGTKTILPAEARARIDIRLVPNMSCDKVVDILKKHLERHGFGDIEVIVHDMYEWSKTDPRHPAVGLAKEVYELLGFSPKIIPMMPGSAPFYVFSRRLSLPVIATGLGYGARAHAPNEFITVSGLKRCIKYMALFIMKYPEIFTH